MSPRDVSRRRRVIPAGHWILRESRKGRRGGWYESLPVKYISPWRRRAVWAALIAAFIALIYFAPVEGWLG